MHTVFFNNNSFVTKWGKSQPISKQAYKAYLRIYRKLKRHGLMCEEFRTRDSFSTDKCWMQVGASIHDLADDKNLTFVRAHTVNFRFH